MYIDSIFRTIFDYISKLAEAGNPLVITGILFRDGGWVFVLFGLLWGLKEVWLYWRQGLYAGAEEYILLAIDVPRDNEQGPKAVESIFAHIAGSYKKPCFYEKYWDGWLPPKFSLELISVGGYVQFLIHLPKKFRDLVEAAIYAQYPDAEIIEVEDYVGAIPTEFPDEQYEMWGTEYTLYNKDHFPIRTYPAFEYGLTQEFKDPMAAILEMMSKISPLENIWLQLVITPVDSSWTEEGQILVKKLIGAKAPEPKASGLAKVGKLGQKIGGGLWGTATASLWASETVQPQRSQEQQRSQMLYLSPGERATVEAVEAKISKIGFDTKFRMIYWGKKEAFSRSRGAYGMAGVINQFNSLDLNGFKSHSKTKSTVDYFKKRREPGRKMRLVIAYKGRSNWRGWSHYVLNIEELATLWHFPVKEVRAPLLKKTEAKRMEPPFALPVELPVLPEAVSRPRETKEVPSELEARREILPVEPGLEEEPTTGITFKIPEERGSNFKSAPLSNNSPFLKEKSFLSSRGDQPPENLPIV